MKTIRVPAIMARRIWVPSIATEAIALDVTIAQAVTIPHGLGRQVQGWLVIWQSAPCAFHVADPVADTSRELVLVPSATCSVRLVLL